MQPAVFAILLVAGLVALLPVRRLADAGWRPGSLLAAWLLYAVAIALVLRSGTLRFITPIVVLAYLAPFVAGPERLARIIRRRPTASGVVIDVTPRSIEGSATGAGTPGAAPAGRDEPEPAVSEPGARGSGETERVG